jgi:hypothetical protein
MKTEQKEHALTSEEQLEAILFQFVTLYDRIAEDRQVTAKQGADIAKFVKEFAREVTQFSSLEEKVRNDIHACIKNEAKSMTTDIGKSLARTAFSETEPTINKLREATNDARRLLNVYYAEMSTTHWKIILAAVASSILTSLLIVWLLMPKPTLPLSDLQLTRYELGKTFSEVWGGLPKEKQDWFWSRATEKKKAALENKK